MTTTSIRLDDLNTTEEEVLANIVGLDYAQKLKDRVTNLTRRAFRMWRTALILEEKVRNKKSVSNG